MSNSAAGNSPKHKQTTSHKFARYDWSREEVGAILCQPFPELVHRAQSVHREFFSPNEVQRSTLLSIKTGGCPEDCKYCPQSAHYNTGLEKHRLLPRDTVIAEAKKAKASGATRFCMGAAWREVKDGKDFETILDLVSAVASLDLEVCCTLGMLTYEQAVRLQQAGCYAYNHNLDTSPEFYGNVISTRTYEDRLRTISHVRKAGMTVCCGGIIGLGESLEDRIGLLHQLSSQRPHPESVPVNMLVRVDGTPLDEAQSVDSIEFVRVIAAARILMPRSYVRLSAGRAQMSDEMQALCFLAGANSIFAGERLLTTLNPKVNEDKALLDRLGMRFVQG